MTSPHLPPLTEHELEMHLASLPRMQMSSRGDELFFSKLNAVLLADRKPAKEERERYAPRVSLFAGFTRFAFTFGMGAFVVMTSLTGLSYRDSVTRGSFLYPLKQAGEQVEGRFAFTTQDTVNTELRFADRRLNEAWNIVKESKPDTQAFLITTAFAQDPNSDIPLSDVAGQALADTLTEMHAHINRASRAVETNALPAQEAADLLTEISDRADAQVQSLKAMRNEAPSQNRNVVAFSAQSQESFVVTLVVAREEVRSVIANRGAQSQVRLENFSVLNNAALAQSNNTLDADDRAQNENARRVLTQLESKITTLAPNDRAIVQARVTEARRALDAGKSSTAYGLSIAITQKIAQDAGVLQQDASVRQNNNILVKPAQGYTPQQVQQVSPRENYQPQSNTSNQAGATIYYRQQPVQNLIDQIPAGSSYPSRTNVQSNVAPQTNVQTNQNTAPIIITPTQYTIAPRSNTYTPSTQYTAPAGSTTSPAPTQIITQPSTTQIQTGGSTTITNPQVQLNGSGTTTIITQPVR